MTNEEMQRTMDFIVEQQAQFATNIQLLQEQQTEITTKIDRLTDSQASAEESRGKDASRLDRAERVLKLMIRAGRRERLSVREQDVRIQTLIDSQLRTSEHINRIGENVDQLIARDASLDERLAQFLAEIVRQLATRQNGNGQAS